MMIIPTLINVKNEMLHWTNKFIAKTKLLIFTISIISFQKRKFNAHIRQINTLKFVA